MKTIRIVKSSTQQYCQPAVYPMIPCVVNVYVSDLINCHNRNAQHMQLRNSSILSVPVKYGQCTFKPMVLVVS